jgi:hypothetical protein
MEITMKKFALTILLAMITVSCSYNSQESSTTESALSPAKSESITLNRIQTQPYPHPIEQDSHNPPYPIIQQSAHPIPKKPIQSTTPTLSTPNTPIFITPTVEPTPEFAFRVPTTNPEATQGLDEKIRMTLSDSNWYKERLRDDVILTAIPIREPTQATKPPIVVFWVDIHTTKDQRRSIEYAPLTASVLTYKDDFYQEQWRSSSWDELRYLESPLWSAGPIDEWHQRRYTIQDVTGDKQPEVILGGCAGFGQECSPTLAIWSLRGELLFLTQSTPEAMGAAIHQDSRTIITREGRDFFQFNAAEVRPREILLSYFTWDGRAFTKVKTESRPFTDWNEPKPEKL